MSFKEKTNRIRNWCKKHEKCIVTVIGVAGGVAACYSMKKTIDIAKIARANSIERNNEAFREFEQAMFVNGIRKQFLGCEGDEHVSIVTDSVDTLKGVCGEGGLCGLRNGEKILVMAQGVAVEHGNDVLETVKDAYSGINDLEIWVGGTVKE